MLEIIIRMNLDIDYWKEKRINLWSTLMVQTLSILYALLRILFIFSVVQAKGNKIIFTALDKKELLLKKKK